MGRPSLAKQRKAEILDAFGRCVARFGLEGSSLERIAEEAGMRRSILRHYVGNRDDLVLALAERVIADYKEATRAFFDELPNNNRSKLLVEFLIPGQSRGSTEQLLIIEGLIGAAPEFPQVRRLVTEYVDELIGLVADALKHDAPKASPSRRWTTAYGLVCISFNHESLQPLELPPKYLRGAKAAARALIETLG